MPVATKYFVVDRDHPKKIMMGWTSRFLSTLALVALSFGCQQRWYLEEPDIVAAKGVSLGATKNEVHGRLGQPQREFNYHSHGHRVSVADYDSRWLDYTPTYEGDDTGILPPRSGINEIYRRDYRLVYIDNRLYAIDDFVHNRYYALPDERMDDRRRSILERARQKQ